MAEFGLGPNGAMLYCMEYLEENFDWLQEGLEALEGDYFIFDIAGQVCLSSLARQQKAMTTDRQVARVIIRLSSRRTTARLRGSWTSSASLTIE